MDGRRDRRGEPDLPSFSANRILGFRLPRPRVLTRLPCQGEHFKLIAGLVPGEKLFSEVSSSNNARAFVGVIEYQLTDPSK